MTTLERFFTEAPSWHEKIGAIHALLERVKISEEQSGDVLHLRKLNRILSVHASTAIEGNQLTLSQVTDVINGKPVWGPPKDIKEVQNAWHAYNALPGYDPWSVADLLRAHAHLTQSLVGESGQFRTGGVAVVGSDGTPLHRGALSKQEVFWGRIPISMRSTRQGRPKGGGFWTLTPINRGRRRLHSFCITLNPRLLGSESWTWGFAKKTCPSGIPAGASRSYWNPTPKTASRHGLCVSHFESFYRWYYKALQDSHASPVVDCRPFIDFMLDASDKTIKRHLKTLREQGRIQRVGSDKTGHWNIIERPL